MTLDSYGTQQNFIAVKDKKKNSKVHFTLVSSLGEVYQNSCCHRKTRDTDMVDKIEDLENLKAILNQSNMCKKCLKIFTYMFPKYENIIEEEL